LKNTVDTDVTTKTAPGTYRSPTLSQSISPRPQTSFSRPYSSASRPQSSLSMRSNFSASRYSIFMEPPLAQLPSAHTSTPDLPSFKPGIWPLPKLHSQPNRV
jgi:hypothetical protein